MTMGTVRKMGFIPMSARGTIDTARVTVVRSLITPKGSPNAKKAIRVAKPIILAAALV